MFLSVQFNNNLFIVHFLKVHLAFHRFRTGEIALDFKTTFDQCKATAKTSPAKNESPMRKAQPSPIKKELFAGQSNNCDYKTNQIMFNFVEVNPLAPAVFIRRDDH